MTSDPVRLLSQSDLTDSERMVLEAAELGVAADYDFAKGEARLLAGLAPLSNQSLPGHAARVLGSVGGKILLGLTLGLALLGTAYVLSVRPAPPAANLPPATFSTTTLQRDVAGSSVALRPVVTSLAPNEAAAATKPSLKAGEGALRPARQEPRRSQPRQGVVKEAGEPIPLNPIETATDPRAELRAIAQAKGLSERDPQAALRLLEQIRVQFPQGYFGEERAALTILALARSGQSALARQQAASFLARYPNGPHSDGVRRAIAAP